MQTQVWFGLFSNSIAIPLILHCVVSVVCGVCMCMSVYNLSIFSYACLYYAYDFVRVEACVHVYVCTHMHPRSFRDLSGNFHICFYIEVV